MLAKLAAAVVRQLPPKLSYMQGCLVLSQTLNNSQHSCQIAILCSGDTINMVFYACCAVDWLNLTHYEAPWMQESLWP